MRGRYILFYLVGTVEIFRVTLQVEDPGTLVRMYRPFISLKKKNNSSRSSEGSQHILVKLLCLILISPCPLLPRPVLIIIASS